jgi:hypothetical protein
VRYLDSITYNHSIKNREERGKHSEEQKAAHPLGSADSPRVVNSNATIKVRRFGYIDDRFNALIGTPSTAPSPSLSPSLYLSLALSLSLSLSFTHTPSL